MHRYAQTNLELHGQLESLGASPADHAAVAAGYRLAADLFSGQYRGSGKPFVAHLVGTASILASLRAPTPVTLAGLLHAAYEQGDFGPGLWRRHADKRREVALVIGTEAENYVQEYFELRWNDAAIASVQVALPVASESRRIVLLVRLANELEDYLSLGLLHCANSSARIARASAHLESQTRLAIALGYEHLAREMSETLSANVQRDLPAAVRNEHDHSFLRVPRSYRRRATTVVRARLARLLG